MRRIQLFVVGCLVLALALPVRYGVHTAKFARLITNQLAAENEFPYQVSLQIRGEHTCGGTLISKKHVLTAAHCVDDIDAGSGDARLNLLKPSFPFGFFPDFGIGFGSLKHPLSSLKVAVGSNKVNDGNKLDVSRIAVHPSYDPVTLDNDVAVITLKKPIKESARVKPIDLPKQNEAIANRANLFTTGYGSRSMEGPTSTVLKKLKMHKVNLSKCQEDWPTLTARQVCAKAPGQGICVGDSGGPLTVDQKTIVGIASAVSPNGCGTNVSDLFTRVSAHVDFIKAEMAKPETKPNGSSKSNDYPTLIGWPYSNYYPPVAWPPSNNVYRSYTLVYG